MAQYNAAGSEVEMIRLTRAQVREVDRLSIEQYAIPGIVLMENAARAVAEVAWEMIHRQPASVLVMCGGGNNGGDGLAAARRLHNRGASIAITLATIAGRYASDALTNWRIVQAMGLQHFQADDEALSDLSGHGLIVDAIFGTGLSQAPRPEMARIIERINASNVPVLAVDVPSGLDCDNGFPLEACIRATRTVTFVAEKAGFANPESRQYTGQVTVADIGCPRELIARASHG